MQLERLAMAPFQTTLMGAVKGALDHYGLAVEAPLVFGLSGHAFLINIHEQLCPSGPYCWQAAPMLPLLRNLGLAVAWLGFFDAKSTPAERALLESRLREALDQGHVCSLLNLENQLIAGYDAEGFTTLQPWAPAKTDYPPARLTFGSWQELGQSVHISFFLFKKARPAARRRAVLASLDYAVDLYARPAVHCRPGYGIGPDAYAHWLAAAPEHGSSHGNWWNATVWSECRKMAAAYWRSLPESCPAAAGPAPDLAAVYDDLGDTLGALADRALPLPERLRLLTHARDCEAKAIPRIAALAATLRQSS